MNEAYNDKLDALYSDTGAAGRITPETHRNAASLNNPRRKREWYLQDFDGVDDCKRMAGCSISGDVITFPEGIDAEDVGKEGIIEFAGAGSGAVRNDLNFTMVERLSSTTMRIDQTAGSGTTTHSKLVHWGTNNDTAIRAALTAMGSNGRGRLRIEGDRPFYTHGSIIGTVGGYEWNCLYQIPTSSYTSGNRGTFEIVGGQAPAFSDTSHGNHYNALPSMNFDGLVIGTTSPSAKTAVFATSGSNPNSQPVNFNYNGIVFKDLKLLVPTNGMKDGAGIGGWNMEWAANHHMENLICNVQNRLSYTREPAFERIGFNSNNLYSDTMNEYRKCEAFAMTSAFSIASEHVNCYQLQAFGCKNALEIRDGMFTINIYTIVYHWGENFVVIKDEGADTQCKVNIFGLEGEAIPMANHPITNDTPWNYPDTEGLFKDLSSDRDGHVVTLIGDNMSGSISMGINPANVGANVAQATYQQFMSIFQS